MLFRSNVMYGAMMNAVSNIQDKWEAFSKMDPEASHLLDVCQLYSTSEDIDPTKFTTLADALRDDEELIELRSKQTNAPTMQGKHALTKPIHAREKAIRDLFNAWAKLGRISNGEGQDLFVEVKRYYMNMNLLHRKQIGRAHV